MFIGSSILTKSSHGRTGEGALGVSVYNGSNPFMKTPPSELISSQRPISQYHHPGDKDFNRKIWGTQSVAPSFIFLLSTYPLTQSYLSDSFYCLSPHLKASSLRAGLRFFHYPDPTPRTVLGHSRHSMIIEFIERKPE